MIDKIDGIFKKERLPAVLLLFGEEDFLLEDSLKRLIKKLETSSKPTFSIDIFDGADISQNDLVSVCASYPMLTDYRAVTVRHFDKMFSGRTGKKQEEKSALAKYLKNPSESAILILEADEDSLNGLAAMHRGSAQKEKAEKKISSAKFPYNIILANHEWLEFPKVYESDFASFITSRFKREGKTISEEAIELLIAQTPPSLRDLASEIDKLCLFVGDKNTVTVDDVHSLVGATRNYNVFELQKAVGERNIKKSLNIVEKMLIADRQEMLIITMLTRYFVALWKLYEEKQKNSNQYKLAASAGVNPYFVNEYLEALKKYNAKELDNALSALCQADYKLKSSSSNSLLIMQTMLLRIIDGLKLK